MRVATWAALLNEKLVVPSAKGNYIAVERNYFMQCLRNAINAIYVDEAYYLDAHPDVADALRQGVIKSAKDHYVEFGFAEHRKPYNIFVEESWYLEQYPDVKAAVGNGAFASGQEHFDLLGFKEGRIPFAGFTLKTAEA